jgi:hypothetical protein
VFAATDWENRPAYDQRDVEYARALAQLLDIVPLSAMVRTVRTRYRAVTSIVVSDLGTVRDHVLGPAHRGGADLEQLAGSLAEAAERILPLSTSQLSEDYRHALLRLLDSDALARGAQLEGGREIHLAVGFVDIVGYTALSGRVDPWGSTTSSSGSRTSSPRWCRVRTTCCSRSSSATRRCWSRPSPGRSRRPCSSSSTTTPAWPRRRVARGCRAGSSSSVRATTSGRCRTSRPG